MKAATVAIIINSFNRLDLLKVSLQALESWAPEARDWFEARIFIYDAGSTDGTLEWLGERQDEPSLQIEVIDGKNDADTSFSAGLNRAVSKALDAIPELDLLLLYETDNQILSAKPVRQALSCLRNDAELAACGFTLRYLNGAPAGTGMPFPKISHFLLGKKLSHRLGLERITYNWQQREATRFSEIDVAFTSPLFVKPAAWLASGGLDAQVFPFSECDVDWAKRLNDLGWRMGVVESDAVIHDNSTAISAWSKNRALHFHRGRLRYFKRHHPIRAALVWPHFLALRHLSECIGVACFIWEKNRRTHLLTQSRRLLRQVFKGYQDES